MFDFFSNFFDAVATIAFSICVIAGAMVGIAILHSIGKVIKKVDDYIKSIPERMLNWISDTVWDAVAIISKWALQVLWVVAVAAVSCVQRSHQKVNAEVWDRVCETASHPSNDKKSN